MRTLLAVCLAGAFVWGAVPTAGAFEQIGNEKTIVSHHHRGGGYGRRHGGRHRGATYYGDGYYCR